MDRTVRARRGPLAGIRVADFCWMGVGSVATRLLADFGAEVIKIEDRTRIDTPRKLPIYKDEPARNFGEEMIDADPDRGGLFNNYCRNKLGVVINMRTLRGRQLAERLIAESSVVSENFAPGVMERWGLTYERLQELSPDVIYARMSGYGHSGPHAQYRSYGPVVQAMSGLSHISGLPGREPSGWGLSYMDNQAAYYNSTALLMAIYGRMRTGQGTEIDVSAIENGINLVGPVLLDVTVNGHTTRRPDFPTGNRLEWPPAAPHGVYPARERTVGSPSPSSMTSSGPVWSPPSHRPHGRPTRASPPRRSASGTRTPSTTMWPLGTWTAIATTSWSCCNDTACRPGRSRTPRTSTSATRRSPTEACSSRWTTRSSARRGSKGHRSSSRASPRTTGDPGPCWARTMNTCSNRSSASVTTSSTSCRGGRDTSAVFEHLTVVELAGDPAGEMTGKIFAQMGADVVKIEPPTGSPSRWIGPFVKGHEDADHSLSFWYYNTDKRSVVLDYATPAGRSELFHLLAEADICITTMRPPEASALGSRPSSCAQPRRG